MLCLKPILLTKLDPRRFPDGLLVSCGSCINCRKARSQEWSLRLDHEKDYAIHKFFVTYTYAAEHIPKCNSLYKGDIQRYFKRLRFNTGSKIRYYACGEYGGRFGRPHYHALIYIYDNKYKKDEWEDKYENTGKQISQGLLSIEWPYGIVKTGTVTTQSIKYVVQYVDKKIMAYDDKPLGHRKPPFRLMSNKLGASYALDNKQQLKTELAIKIKDKEMGLPRYYKKILQIHPKQILKKYKALELQELKKYMKKQKLKKMDLNQWKIYYELNRQQKSKNHESKYNINKQKNIRGF